MSEVLPVTCFSLRVKLNKFVLRTDGKVNDALSGGSVG